jgi:hypothetical protein
VHELVDESPWSGAWLDNSDTGVSSHPKLVVGKELVGSSGAHGAEVTESEVSDFLETRVHVLSELSLELVVGIFVKEIQDFLEVLTIIHGSILGRCLYISEIGLSGSFKPLVDLLNSLLDLPDSLDDWPFNLIDLGGKLFNPELPGSDLGISNISDEVGVTAGLIGSSLSFAEISFVLHWLVQSKSLD